MPRPNLLSVVVALAAAAVARFVLRHNNSAGTGPGDGYSGFEPDAGRRHKPPDKRHSRQNKPNRRQRRKPNRLLLNKPQHDSGSPSGRRHSRAVWQAGATTNRLGLHNRPGVSSVAPQGPSLALASGQRERPLGKPSGRRPGRRSGHGLMIP
jgi:hypothetical protein